MSAFDAENFFDSNVTNEVGSTVLNPVPANTYKAIIEKVSARPWSNEQKGTSGITVDVSYAIVDDNKAIEEVVGRPPKVTQGYFADLIPNTMQMDYSKGKNVSLMRVREAVGQNVAGQNWNPKMMEGQALQIVVVLDPQKNSDVTYNRVKSVAPLGM